MEWIRRLKQRYAWIYVGTCSSETFLTRNGVDTGVTYSQHYMLMVRGDGKRKVVKTGEKYANSSVYGRKVEAEVKAWIIGGPLPRYVAVEQKKEGKLILLKGGKT